MAILGLSVAEACRYSCQPLLGYYLKCLLWMNHVLRCFKTEWLRPSEFLSLSGICLKHTELQIKSIV